MTLYERDWQNICKKERKIEKTIKVGLAKYLNRGGIESANFLIHAGNG